MSDVPTYPVRGSGRYEVRVQGHLDPRWAACFDGFSLTTAADGTTVIAGRTDQAGLHGVLCKLADIGLTLVAVTPAAAPDDPATGTTDSS